MERVTVIIPTYNRAHVLQRSINSVLQQTYENIEIIVVDDCSVDNTEEVIQGITDKRLKYFKLENNMGACYARNAGAKIAETKYIAFQDSDDIWLPQKLEKQMKLFWDKSDYALVYCKMHIIEIDNERYIPDENTKGMLEGDIWCDLIKRNVIGTPSMVMKRRVFLDLGGFDESLKRLQDWELALRVADKYRIGYVEEPLLDVYYDGKGVSSSIWGYFDTRCKVIARFRKRMEEMGVLEGNIADLFNKAEDMGILSQVKELLVIYLKQYGSI